MAGQRVAVVGVGQTVHRTARKDVSMAGLVREAAQEALDDAGMTWSDIDAVVIGKAPDMFEGVAMPELYLADALGAVGKPMMRVHTAGSVGGSTSIVAAKLVAAGVHERVLTVRRGKSMRAIVRDGIQLIELVLAQAFRIQAAGPKPKPNDHQHAQHDGQQSAI